MDIFRKSYFAGKKVTERLHTVARRNTQVKQTR